MKHGKVSFVSPSLVRNVSGDKICMGDSVIFQTLKRNESSENHHHMHLNASGQCCDLPAILAGTSCSFDYCKHCTYSGETDALKRANGTGSCTWHLYGKSHNGLFEAGIPCGWGTRTWDDGVVYQGFWKGHKLNGRGLISFVDGSTYHGMLVESIRTGDGAYRSTSGFSYHGCWLDDKPHGRGESTDDCRGIKYSGDWEFGLMHGFGVMTILDSNGAARRYEGAFIHGMREGLGLEESENDGTSYNGSWHQNLRHGVGTEVILGQGVYIGQWKDGLRHGPGVFKSTNPSQSHYEGEWQYGLRHGRGIVRWNTGDSFACRFVNGKMTGHGILHSAAGSASHRHGATLIVHSDTIHTTKTGSRASASQAGTLLSESHPVYFLLPARRIISNKNKVSDL
jgi:hypothetical protein